MEKGKSTKPKSGHIFGVHAVMEAIHAGRQIDKLYLKKGMTGDVRNTLLEAISKEVPVQDIPQEKLDHLSGGGHHQGVVAAIAHINYVPFEDTLILLLEKPKPPVILLLDQVSDVRNFGAIARTAECLGADLLVLPRHGAAAVNAESIKVSAGALHHLPVARVDHIVDAVMLLQAYNVQVVATTDNSSESLYDHDFSKQVAIIIGSEGKGVNGKLLKMADARLSIPMQGDISSLNVSVATGVVLAEVQRQRNV